MKNTSKQKVFVGLSGGVDSSVAALLLKRQGYDVTGVFIKAWHPDFLPCNWRGEMRDAMRICARLKIPFLMCDLEKEYKKEVVDYLIKEYTAGNTPNPDVLCNKEIKFGGFLKFALEKGADFVATGHYAKRTTNTSGQVFMEIPADTEKDQTYFLWTLNQQQISKILFPLGDLKKSEVRKIAEDNNLHTSSKKDSQGLCFLGHVDMKNFLRRYIETVPGDVLNLKGEIVGSHDGSELYTIGERHGFRIAEGSEPHFVISKNIDDNTITVSTEISTERDISTINLKNTSFISDTEPTDKEVRVKVRYRGEFLDGKISKTNGGWTLDLHQKITGVSSGQSVVMYQGDLCLGGGVVV